MSRKAEIEAFDWSDRIIVKLWKHNIEWWEVEEAVIDDPASEIRKVKDAMHGERWLAKGRTASGRKLRIYLNPCRNRPGMWFCITAWEEEK